MYCATGIGPAIAMSRRISASSGDDVVHGHVGRAPRRRIATAMRTMPASISGSDSSIPMVSPPQRKPSCGSGSRNSSQNERAMP